MGMDHNGLDSIGMSHVGDDNNIMIVMNDGSTSFIISNHHIVISIGLLRSYSPF